MIPKLQSNGYQQFFFVDIIPYVGGVLNELVGLGSDAI